MYGFHLKLTTISSGDFIVTDANVIVTVTSGKISSVTYGEAPTTTAITAVSAGSATLVEYGRLTEQGKIDVIFHN